jgi:uncharacterized protein YdaU (DUF1376 family)
VFEKAGYMHYYQFNIGDYASHTRHLDLLEDLAYRRILDLYYLHERPISGDASFVAKQIGMRDDAATVRDVLNEFFERTDEGYVNSRADKEIAHYHSKIQQASRAGKASAERRLNGRSTDVATDVQPNIKQETINIKQETKKIATDVAVVFPDWLPLETWDAFIKMRKRIKKPPTDYAVKLLINKLDGFRAKGQDVKEILERSITSSWQDLYEIASVKQPFNKFDAITTTVPGSKEKDPALVKLDEDAKRAAAPSLETLQRLAALRQEIKNG